MAVYRLTRAASEDIASILAWSQEEFGEEARVRYEALIAAAVRDASGQTQAVGHVPRPELGEGVLSWHLSGSRDHSSAGRVRRPRHFLIWRRDGAILIIGRVLHDAMELRRHVEPSTAWD